jgi:hypothetical protein
MRQVSETTKSGDGGFDFFIRQVVGFGETGGQAYGVFLPFNDTQSFSRTGFGNDEMDRV